VPAPDNRPGEHYFSASPASSRVPREIRLVVGDDELHLSTDAGVFSGDHLDPGTSVLLTSAPPPPEVGTLLDLGCGYGAIACSLARRAPAARVLAVDVNERALDLTRKNADRHGLTNVTVARPDEVSPSTRFDAIYTNPPIRIGKAALHALLAHWLARLSPGGAAYLVVHRNLGSDSLQRWLNEQGWPCDRLRSVRGYRVLAVRALAGAERAIDEDRG
jgi:16S rRNA (guanine1207-N2)-methyltransferase